MTYESGTKVVVVEGWTSAPLSLTGGCVWNRWFDRLLTPPRSDSSNETLGSAQGKGTSGVREGNISVTRGKSVQGHVRSGRTRGLEKVGEGRGVGGGRRRDRPEGATGVSESRKRAAKRDGPTRRGSGEGGGSRGRSETSP